MATEEDRQEERERLGNDPFTAPEPSDEQLEEESSLESPAAPRSGDPHAIEEQLEGADEYQAPSRENEQEEGEPATYEDGQPVDINLLEAQRQKPGLQTSETIVSDPSQARHTISGRDEESHEPGAVPPGETM